MAKLKDTEITGDLTVSGDILPESWTAPTFQNSWVNYDTTYNQVGYFKDKYGIVHLRGLVKSGTVGGSTPIFTLPEGYRPIKRCIFVTISNGSIGRCDVKDTGEVIANNGSNSWFSLEGISFRAEL